MEALSTTKSHGTQIGFTVFHQYFLKILIFRKTEDRNKLKCSTEYAICKF